MDDFFTEVFLQPDNKTITDSIINVDRYARELNSFILYKPVDKVSNKPISPEQLKKLRAEKKRCEDWVDKNQWKLTGL